MNQIPNLQKMLFESGMLHVLLIVDPDDGITSLTFKCCLVVDSGCCHCCHKFLMI